MGQNVLCFSLQNFTNLWHDFIIFKILLLCHQPLLCQCSSLSKHSVHSIWRKIFRSILKTNKQPRRRNASSASDGLEFKSLHCAAEIRRRRRPIFFSSPSLQIFLEIFPPLRLRLNGNRMLERLVKIRKDILSLPLRLFYRPSPTTPSSTAALNLV